MQQHSSQELFSLTIDPTTKVHLSETAKWARFLAIIGFIFCGLIVIGGILFASSFAAFLPSDMPESSVATSGLGVAMAIIYIIGAAIYFFPCLFLYRFAQRMRIALAGNEQEDLNESFSNLKSLFRYVGIITIIFLAFYALFLLIMLLGYAAS